MTHHIRVCAEDVEQRAEQDQHSHNHTGSAASVQVTDNSHNNATCVHRDICMSDAQVRGIAHNMSDKAMRPASAAAAEVQLQTYFHIERSDAQAFPSRK